jgi:hypothetical protein
LEFGEICVNLHFVPNYSETITEFEAELKRLFEQRGHIDRQIANLAKAIEAIKALAEQMDEPIIPAPLSDQAGFTEKVRALLRANAAKGLTAVEIRDSLLQASPKEDPKIMLIHTHNTVKRLHKQGEVDEIVERDGRVGYRRKTELLDIGGTVINVLESLQNPNTFSAFLAAQAMKKAKSKEEDEIEHPAMKLKDKARVTLGQRIAKKD